jgi:hypothetical protein
MGQLTLDQWSNSSRVVFETEITERHVEIGISVEARETRGTTALVYLQLHSSLYTGTVHVLSSGVHPTGLTTDQGCRQVSTYTCIRHPEDGGICRSPDEVRDSYYCILTLIRMAT